MNGGLSGSNSSGASAKRIVVLGAPRSGTTVVKRYLASNEGCQNTPYPGSLEQVLRHEQTGSIPVWKRTRWIDPDRVREVVSRLRGDTLFVVVVRYPSCCYASTVELDAFRGRTCHKWLPHRSLPEYLEWWERSHRLAFAEVAEVPHVVLPYEDFCLRPQHWRSLIMDAVGLSAGDGASYDNREFYIEDEKCVAHSEVHGNSVFRSPEDSEVSELYRLAVGFPCPGRRSSVRETDYRGVVGSGVSAASLWTQVQDVEGWLKRGFAEFFARLLPSIPHGNLLEIGSAYGQSTIYFALALMSAKRYGQVFSVDPHTGGVRFRNRLAAAERATFTSWPVFLENLRKKGVEHRVVPYCMTSEVARSVPEIAAARWSFIYIDGWHSYDAVVQDLRWVEALRPGGIVAVDDCDWPEVCEAVDECLGELELLHEVDDARFYRCPHPESLE